MKKVLKILSVFLIVLTIVSNVTLAYDFAQQIQTIDGQSGNDDLNNTAKNIVGAIVSVMKIVAVGVAIIFLLIVAMKYMSSAPGDRAEIKKHAVVYVVGAVILFGATGILTIIQEFAKNI